MWCSCAADLAWLLQQPGHTVGIHWFEDCGGKPASVQIYRKHLRHFVLLYFSCEIITSRRKTPCTTRSCFAFRDPARRQVCQPLCVRGLLRPNGLAMGSAHWVLRYRTVNQCPPDVTCLFLLHFGLSINLVSDMPMLATVFQTSISKQVGDAK